MLPATTRFDSSLRATAKQLRATVIGSSLDCFVESVSRNDEHVSLIYAGRISSLESDETIGKSVYAARRYLDSIQNDDRVPDALYGALLTSPATPEVTSLDVV